VPECIEQFAVFIDIDGTLMGKNDSALCKNLVTIQKVRDMGHKVFINTGRSTAYLPDKIDYKKYFDGIISGGGAVIKIGNDIVSKKLMHSDLIKKFSKFIIENKIQGYLEGYEKMYHFGFSEEYEETWIKVDKENLEQLLSNDLLIEKFTVLGDMPLALDAIMGSQCQSFRFKTYAEIIRKDCGKGNALIKTANHLGIKTENTIAIGDSLNDLYMINAAGFGVAMGNAQEEIKEIADMIVDTVDNAGVSDALKRIFNVE
jgi:Cof subfamily protein (haloacid dehalogenase superfamily)